MNVGSVRCLDVRAKLTEELKKSGIKIRYETNVERVEKLSDDSYRVKFQNDETTVETSLVMFAIGRKPETEHLGLDKAGVKTNDKDVILVDDYSQTNVSNIYAVSSRQCIGSFIDFARLSGRRLYRSGTVDTRRHSRGPLSRQYALQQRSTTQGRLRDRWHDRVQRTGDWHLRSNGTESTGEVRSRRLRRLRVDVQAHVRANT